MDLISWKFSICFPLLQNTLEETFIIRIFWRKSEAPATCGSMYVWWSYPGWWKQSQLFLNFLPLQKCIEIKGIKISVKISLDVKLTFGNDVSFGLRRKWSLLWHEVTNWFYLSHLSSFFDHFRLIFIFIFSFLFSSYVYILFCFLKGLRIVNNKCI